MHSSILNKFSLFHRFTTKLNYYIKYFFIVSYFSLSRTVLLNSFCRFKNGDIVTFIIALLFKTIQINGGRFGKNNGLIVHNNEIVLNSVNVTLQHCCYPQKNYVASGT